MRNNKPSGKRRSTFIRAIAALTKDQIKYQSQKQDADPEWNWSGEPAAARFGRFFRQRIDQPFSFFFGAWLCQKADHQGGQKTDSPSINRRIKILRHLT